MTQQQEVTLENALNIGLTHMRSENYRVAEMVFRDILASEPEHHESYYYLGLARYYLGDIQQAIEYVGKAVDSDEATVEWWCNYGIFLNNVTRYEDAVKAYEKAEELDSSYANIYWNKSHTLWLDKRYEEAEIAARRTLEIDPNISEAWLNLGTALVKLDKTEEALEAWEKCLEINPGFAMAWSNMGNALRELGKLEASEEKCRKAVELDPNYPEALCNLGNVLLDQGHIEDAESFYRKAVMIKPDYIEAHNNLSIALISQHRYEEALMHTRYAISYNPGYADAYVNMCGALRALGNLEDAQQAIQKAVILDPNSADVRINMAEVLFMSDRYGDAEIELSEAKKLNPDSPRIYLRLSQVFERGNKIPEALEAIDKAIELSPEMPEAYLRKASICHISNDPEEALKYFKKTIEIAPGMAVAHASMADFYQTIGDIEASAAASGKAKELNPDLPTVYYSISKIKKFTSDDPDFKKIVELNEMPNRFGIDQSCILNFTLFSAYEGLGDYEKAFEHLKRANDLKRKMIPYSEERQKNINRLILENFTKEKLDILKGHGFETDTPVFIVGMPRSGTTLTEQIISSHPNVFGAGELMYVSTSEAQFGAVNENNAEDIGKWYVEKVKKRDKSGTAKRITDKMPGNFSQIGKIVSILPNAKIIHCRRNPIDTCLSCYKQNFAVGQYWSYNLEEMGMFYNQYLELIEHWRTVLPDRFIEIDYEDTVNNTEDQARKLIDHVELPWDDACLEPHKQKRAVLTASKMQVIKPVYKTSVKGWKRYEKQLQPLIDSLSKGPAKDLLDI